MSTPSLRFLIVNADDFGLTSGVNRGIIEAHEHGIVTSASLMVRGAAAKEAADYARGGTKLSVGLHLDLAEWRCRNGEWFAAYEVVDASDADAVHRECARQLREFASLMQRAPTHIDSHQHVHVSEPARSVVRQIAAELDVPLRRCAAQINYDGSFYGQTNEGDSNPDGVSSETLVRLIEHLPLGWTEFGCHPGYADDLDSVYRLEREAEIRALCSDAARTAVQKSDAQLRSFADFTDRRRASMRE